MRKFLTLLAVLVLSSVLAFAQTKTVTGKVLDQQGQPVPFATIRIKDSKGGKGVSADADGNYSIKVNQGSILVVTGAGFSATEVTVGDIPTMNVTVNRKDSNLTEVVVTALGVRRNRSTLPYASQQISGDDVNKTITTNAVNNLSGKVAGLQITASNAMGGSSNVILRGFRSLTQSNQALFVVDGVPYDNTITTGGGYDFGSAAADLNPDDIASIDVLKGGAASALYGSRGSNGVILVTTKRGSPRKQVAVSASFGVSAGSPDKSTLPKYQTTYGQGYEERPASGFYTVTAPWSPTNIQTPWTDGDAATGPAYDPSKLVYNWDAAAPSDPNFHKATPWAPAAHHDPTDYMVTPVTTTESILVSGGGENGTFKFNYTRDDEKGYFPNSTIKKNLFDLATTYNITKSLSVEGGLNYVNEYATNRFLYQYTAKTNPMTDFRQWWPTNVNIQSQKHDYFAAHQNETWNWQQGAYEANVLGNVGVPAYHDNLYWYSYQNPENDARNRYTGHARVNMALTSYLSLTGTVTEDYYDQSIEQRADVGSQATSFYSRQNNIYNETNYSVVANFNKNIGNNFVLRALLGGNIQKDNISSIFASTSGGLILPGFWSISNSVSTPAAPTETLQRKEIHSEYGGATLSWKEMLTLDATLRRDQSSTLPASNDVYYYPSVSGNFVFSKILPQAASWLSFGKVWVNYAQVGGDAPYYSVYNTYTINTPIHGQAAMFNATSKPNQFLIPEKNKSYEVGLEMEFLNRRLGFTADYYHAVQSNEILPINVSTSTGYNTFSVNGGSVQNQGVEVTLNINPVKTRDFNWNMTINWSKNMNKVLSLYGGQPSTAIGTLQNSVQIVAEVGKPYGILRGSTYTYVNGQKQIGANGKYVDSSNKLSDIGSIQADWIGGINNSFTYKNFALSFLLDFHHGGDVYSLDMDYGSYSGLYPRTAAKNSLGNNNRDPLASGGGDILPGVTADGKPNTKRILENVNQGSWTYGSGSAGSETNKQFVYDASYIKLREVAFTYSIPAKALEGLHSVKGIDLSLSGRNLWIIHKNLPYSDPEQGQAAGNLSIGYQNGAYPTMRTLNFIIKARF
jgi:TonB-linked SusC/RagA family outer membrane protein